MIAGAEQNRYAPTESSVSDIHASAFWQIDIAYHGVIPVSGQRPGGGHCIASFGDIVPLLAENDPNDIAHFRHIVDDKDTHGLRSLRAFGLATADPSLAVTDSANHYDTVLFLTVKYFRP
jgi:hypothetical protein